MFLRTDSPQPERDMVAVTVDETEMRAVNGEPVAALLLRVAPYTSRTTPVSGAARAPFCMMGACFDCLVEIDGRTSVRACMVPIRDGMTIRRQAGRPALRQIPAA